MPKAPITSRTLLYDVRADDSYFDLDWNIVNTSVGQMIEPRCLIAVPIGENFVPVDQEDNSFTDRSQTRNDQLFDAYGTGGQQLPAKATRTVNV